MSTLTLNVPDDLLTKLEARAAAIGEDRNNYALAVLTRDLETVPEDEDFPLTPEVIEALKQGAADIEAGRTSNGRENMARRRAALGMPPYSAPGSSMP